MSCSRRSNCLKLMHPAFFPEFPKMAHGPDTEELLRRVANTQYVLGHLLNVSDLNITSLPELPLELEFLYCYTTQITHLPKLPSGLKVLWCYKTPLTSLPDLPSELYELDCSETNITHLPDIPFGLRTLVCYSTPLATLPELPSTLRALDCYSTPLATLPELSSRMYRLTCYNTPLILQRGKEESIPDYNRRWRAWREEQAAKRRAKERSAAIKEELVAAA